jgi:Domain of unknown function (DUF4249)
MIFNRLKIVSHFFLCTALSIFLFSCETLVNDIDTDRLPQGKTQLVVQGFLSPQDTLISVRISATTPVFGQIELYPTTQPAITPEIMKGLNVTISEGSRTATLTLNTQTGNYEAAAALLPIAVGKTYALRITNAAGDVFESSCTVPQAVPITQVKVDSSTGTFTSNKLVQLYWQDPAGTAHYYRVGGFVEEKFKYASPFSGQDTINIQLFYPGFERQGRRGDKFISDENQNGLSMTSGASRLDNYYFTNSENSNRIAIRIEYFLITSDKNYYDYHRIVRNFDDDNPFIEPTLIPSNIKNGLGCFAAYNRSFAVIR